jgi:folate-binding protein YgfZ
MNRQEFLSRFNLQLDARGRCQPETPPQTATTWLSSLDHWAVLSISGPDTRKFLQGQLTCDVSTISDTQGAYGALCTPKGRMISNFYLIQGADSDSLLMLLPADSLEATQQTLSKYIVFSKAEMQAENTYLLLGLGGEQAAAVLEQDAPQTLQTKTADWGVSLACNEDRFMLAVKEEALAASWEKLAEKAQPVGGHHWELADIADGIGFVYNATQEEFIPQALNMQLTDGISFEKGCYTGQEIVARTQYRGKIKRHMRHFSGAAENAPAPGDSLLNAQGKAIATVVTAESENGRLELLAVVTGNWAEGSITTEQGSVLAEQTLPYTIPVDDEE